MKRRFRYWPLVCVACLIFSGVGTVFAEQNAKSYNKLFVSLTSDEINKAAMAIMFATMTQKSGTPTCIFLNVDGVRLAENDDTRPAAMWGGSGDGVTKSVHELLEAFMDADGVVIICPMCMKNVGGMTKEDLFDPDIQLGNHGLVSSYLFEKHTTVLSY